MAVALLHDGFRAIVADPLMQYITDFIRDYCKRHGARSVKAEQFVREDPASGYTEYHLLIRVPR